MWVHVIIICIRLRSLLFIKLYLVFGPITYTIIKYTHVKKTHGNTVGNEKPYKHKKHCPLLKYVSIRYCPENITKLFQT